MTNKLVCLKLSWLSYSAALFFVFSPLLTGATGLNDAESVPHLDSAGQESYRDFLSFDKHRAFAIAPGGTWAWKGAEPTAESASDNALQVCRKESGLSCILYALDDQVVFDPKAWARLWGPYLNRTEAGQAHIGLNRGEQFHDLMFKDAHGKLTTISDLRGHVVIVHFWGSWCPPCRSEMPELQQLHQALSTTPDVKMVLLQVEEEFSKSRQWIEQQHLSLPVYDSGANSKLANSLSLADGGKIHDRDIAPAFPSTYILDKHGIVVYSNIGQVSHWTQYLPLLRDVALRSGK